MTNVTVQSAPPTLAAGPMAFWGPVLVVAAKDVLFSPIVATGASLVCNATVFFMDGDADSVHFTIQGSMDGQNWTDLAESDDMVPGEQFDTTVTSQVRWIRFKFSAAGTDGATASLTWSFGLSQP